MFVLYVTLCLVWAIKSFMQVNMTKYIFNGSHMLHKVQEKFKNAYNDSIQCAKCL